MTGIDGRVPSRALLARVRAGQVGGVILFAGTSHARRSSRGSSRALQAAAADGGNPPLLIAVDQEGGAVKRLPAGPPDLSPAAMGRDGAPPRRESQGAATGGVPAQRGIDVDLAPVLDTPDSPSSFLGTRAFSRDPRLNAALGTAFVEGLQLGGVAATAKHFPGLGTARRSTDTTACCSRRRSAASSAQLLPFARAIDAGVKLVMVSNAGYSALRPDRRPGGDLAADRHRAPARPARLRRRRDQRRDGGARRRAAGPAPRCRALAAGVDVLLYTSERSSAAGYAELAAAAKSGTLSPGRAAKLGRAHRGAQALARSR